MKISDVLDVIRLTELAGGDLLEARNFVANGTPPATVRALLAARIDEAIAAKPHLAHLADVKPQAAAAPWSDVIDAVNKSSGP